MEKGQAGEIVAMEDRKKEIKKRLGRQSEKGVGEGETKLNDMGQREGKFQDGDRKRSKGEGSF